MVTPVLVGAASLSGRRWGQAVAGWLVGLPFTSGPVMLFLALDHGLGFSAAAAGGSVIGTIAQAAFALAYARTATRGGWRLRFVAGTVGFVAAAAALRGTTLPLIWLLLATFVVLAAALLLIPRGDEAIAPAPPPRWDIPARMVVSTALVLVITGLAPALGPRLSGVVTTFPVYAATLAVFAHRHGGPSAAVPVLRGLLFGLFSFAGFFVVLATLLERLGLVLGFAAAIAAALAIQGGTLALILAARRERAPRLT